MAPLKALVIGGNIAAGKSTVAPLIAEELGACLIKEPVESWRRSGKLQAFYDGKLSAFEFQMYVLETRSSALNVQLSRWEDEHDGAQPEYLVLDRWLDDDLVFATVNHQIGRITDADYAEYKRRHAEISRDFRHRLDIRVVWIGTTPEECMERIQKRGRGEEASITLEYLQALHDCRPAPDLWVDGKSSVDESFHTVARFARMAWGMTAIVAVSLNGVIGCKGAIPWKEPEDLKFFWGFMENKDAVVGRRTFESIPAHLFERAGVRSITVLSRDPAKGITWDQFLAGKKLHPDMVVIGGAEVYAEAFRRGVVSRVVKTTIPRQVDGDAYIDIPYEFQREELVIEFLTRSNSTSP